MEAKATKINQIIIYNNNLNKTCILPLNSNNNNNNSSSKSSSYNSRDLQKMIPLGCRKAPYQRIVTFREPTKYLSLISLANKISNIYHNKNINNRSYHLLKVLSAYLSLVEALHKQRAKQVIWWERQRRVSSLEEQEAKIETCILLSQM